MSRPNLPQINRMKFGIIVADYMNTLADGVRTFSDMKGAIDEIIAKKSLILNRPFMARITGVSPLIEMELLRYGGNEDEDEEIIPVSWKYDWETINVKVLDPEAEDLELTGIPILEFTEYEDTPTSEQVREVADNEVAGYALNMAEIANHTTFPIVNGVDIQSSQYDQDSYPEPVAVGTVVNISRNTSENSTLFYTFDRMGGHSLVEKEWFFAKLLRAHVMSPGETLLNPNQFEYAWCKVTMKSCGDIFPCGLDGEAECCAECLRTRCTFLASCCPENCTAANAILGHWRWEEDLSVSSWGEYLTPYNEGCTGGGWSTAGGYDPLDPLAQPCVPDTPNHPCNTIPYTHPAMNIIESFNTSTKTATGTNEEHGIGNFMLQAIGGGSSVLDYEIADICDDDPFVNCTQYEFPLSVTPIVKMHRVKESDGTVRYVFQAANSYDGTCATC